MSTTETIETTQVADTCEALQAANDTLVQKPVNQEKLYRADTQLQSMPCAPSCVRDLEVVVTEYCAGKTISAEHQKMMLAALIMFFEWEDFSGAIIDLFDSMMDTIMEKVANCSLENPDPRQYLRFQIGWLDVRNSLPELLGDAASYLPYMADDLLTNR